MSVEIVKVRGAEGTGYRLGFTADQHLGNHKRFGGEIVAGLNRRCLDHVRALQAAVLRARNVHKCRSHTGLGDLFDNEKPLPQIVAAAQRVLAKLPTDLLVGNHEQNTTAEGDHSASPLAPVARVFEVPTLVEYDGVVDVLAVPFMTGAPAAETLPAVLSEFAKISEGDRRVLALHLGIADDSTAPWLTRGHNWIHIDQLVTLAKKHRIEFTIAGDWHEHKEWTRGSLRFMQCGALVPTGFDNPGTSHYGSLIIFDGETGSVERDVIPGPRFVQGTSFDTVEVPDDDSQLYVEITCSPDKLRDEQSKLEYWRSHAMLIDGEVRPDKAEIEIDARDAARAARSADTLAKTTSEFVSRMPLPDGVDRASVQARIERYLA